MQHTLGNGEEVLEKVLGNSTGLTAQCIKDNGKKIKQMVEVNSRMLMVMFTKAIGRMIKPMEKVFLNTKMEPCMMVNGKMTCSMAEV